MQAGRRQATGLECAAMIKSEVAAACSLLIVVLSTAGCATATPRWPVVPDAIEHTPASLVAGVAATATGTPGPSPTPEVIATRVVPPPEPLNTAQHVGVGLYADEVGPVRMMALAPNGLDVFVSVPSLDRILVLPDRDRDGVADATFVYAQGDADGLNYPHGLAFDDGYLYVANTDGVVRFRYDVDDIKARGRAEFLVELPGGGIHNDRSLLFGPEGEMLVTVGSSCNVCLEDDFRRASILRFEPDGRATRLAHGLRHSVGLAIEPTTGSLWATDVGRDGLGQHEPPDELNLIVAGADYGWPYCYGDNVFDAELGGSRDACEGTFPPVVKLSAHAAPHGIAFYEGDAFPQRYHGGLFLAQHGLVGQYLPTGHSLVFLPFENGMPTGELWPVVDGWLRPDTRRWGSPVDVLEMPDGALLVTDDGGGRVYRVFYDGPPPTATPFTPQE